MENVLRPRRYCQDTGRENRHDRDLVVHLPCIVRDPQCNSKTRQNEKKSETVFAPPPPRPSVVPRIWPAQQKNKNLRGLDGGVDVALGLPLQLLHAEHALQLLHEAAVADERGPARVREVRVDVGFAKGLQCKVTRKRGEVWGVSTKSGERASTWGPLDTR